MFVYTEPHEETMEAVAARKVCRRRQSILSI